MNIYKKGPARVILVVLVVLALVAAGYGLFFHKGSESAETPPTPDADFSIEETLKDGVYTNERFGFQFTVPDTWQLAEDAPYIIRSDDYAQIIDKTKFGGAGGVEVTAGAELYIAPQVTSIMKNISDVQKFNALGVEGPGLQNERMIKVGGYDGLLYDFTDVNDAKGQYLDILRGDVWIQIGIRYKGANGQEVFDNLIKTFKFLR